MAIYGQGLFRESDHLSLSTTISLDGNRLIDDVTGLEHKLHYLAAASLNRLSHGVLFHKWLVFMQNEQLRIGEINQIVDFINELGGFNISRSLAQKLNIIFIRFRYLLKGQLTPSLKRRQMASVAGLGRAVLMISWPVALATLIVSAALWLSGWFSEVAIAWFSLSFYLLVVVSLFTHEYAHLWLVRKTHLKALVIFGGLRIGILHQKLPDSVGMASILIGPVIGFLIALLLSLAIWIISHQAIILLNGASVAAFNLVSLLPFYGDGQSLVRHLFRKGTAAP